MKVFHFGGGLHILASVDFCCHDYSRNYWRYPIDILYSSSSCIDILLL